MLLSVFASAISRKGIEKYIKEFNHNGAAISLWNGFMALIVLTLLNNAARITQNMIQYSGIIEQLCDASIDR